MLYRNHAKDINYDAHQRIATNAYEQTVACMLYARLRGLMDTKAAELIENGTLPFVAEQIAALYVESTYCDGYACAIYAVAQARLQLLREGYIPSNATTMPNPWSYDPYTRLYTEYAEAVLGLNA